MVCRRFLTQRTWHRSVPGWALVVVLCLLFSPGSVEGAGAAGRAAARRPNIVFLLSDDQRADTIHALGNAVIATPHLDRLVLSLIHI